MKDVISCEKLRGGANIHRSGAVSYTHLEEEVFHVEKRWGYFSKKDMKKDSFDLCEKCYDEVTAEFVIPVETKEEIEFFPC